MIFDEGPLISDRPAKCGFLGRHTVQFSRSENLRANKNAGLEEHRRTHCDLDCDAQVRIGCSRSLR
jgi:hypothetical protein